MVSSRSFSFDLQRVVSDQLVVRPERGRPYNTYDIIYYYYYYYCCNNVWSYPIVKQRVTLMPEE